MVSKESQDSDSWPPPPQREDVEPVKPDRWASLQAKFGLASLGLSAPGTLLSFQFLLFDRLHLKDPPVVFSLENLYYSGFILIFVLPIFGFFGGIIGWRSWAGKAAILCSLVDWVLIGMVVYIEL